MPTRGALVLATFCLLLTGCFGGNSVISPEQYTGPPLHLETLEARHLIVFRAPSPGWAATIDRTERRLDTTRVFLTLRRPDPGMLYAQVMVDQRVLTPVPASRELTLYARTIDFGKHDSEPSYHLVPLPTTESTIEPASD
jgi:hypothetical protein